MKDQSVADVLIRAKELIDTPEKWGKGDERYPGGKLCAYDAVCKTHSPKFEHRAIDCLNTIHARFSVWQDKKCRTHAEVMEAFDKAIQLAKEKETE